MEADIFHPNAGDKVRTIRLGWWVIASDEREDAHGRYGKPGCAGGAHFRIIARGVGRRNSFAVTFEMSSDGEQLILRRLICGVDYQDFHRLFPRYEPQAKLLLEGGEE